MEPIFITFIVFGSIGFIVWRWIDSRHKERMAMIAQGLSPNDEGVRRLQELMKTSPRMFQSDPLSSLKWGLVAAFVGGGLMFAVFIDRTYWSGDSIYPSSMLIAGGLALILFYLISARKQKKEASKE